MQFTLIDAILERSDDRIVAVKQVTLAEEYLSDHFPTFPILPGVLMVETMVQAARALLAGRGDPRLVLGEVRTVKFGAMVRPGEGLRVEVVLVRVEEDGSYVLNGAGTVVRPGLAVGETAVRGRFTMRPLRRTAGDRSFADAGIDGHDP